MAARTLSVLAAYSSESPRQTLSELAAATGLPLSTTHRLVAELVAWGALARRPDGRYEIGRRMGISKNAVVGKAHRLNLPARPSPIRR